MSEFQKEVIKDIKNIVPELDENKINEIINSVLKSRKKYKYNIAELKLLVEEAIAIIKLVEHREHSNRFSYIRNISIDKLNEYYIEIISKIRLLEKKINLKDIEEITPTWRKIGSIRGNAHLFNNEYLSYSDMRFLDEVIFPEWIKLGKPLLDMQNKDILEIISKSHSAISDFANQANIENPVYEPEYYELTKDINNNILLNGMRLTNRNISVGTNIEKLVEAIFRNKDKEFNPQEVIYTAKAISNILDGVGIDKNIRKIFFPKLNNSVILFTPQVSRNEAQNRGINLFKIDYILKNADIPPTKIKPKIDLSDIPF